MKKERTLLRILVAYLCVIIPLLVVSFYVTQNLLDTTKTETEARIRQQLEQASQSLESDFYDYQINSISLKQNYDFYSGKLMLEPMLQLEAAEILQNLKLFDGKVDEIQIYNGYGMLYGNTGSVSPNVYFGTTLALTPESVQDGIALISSEKSNAAILATSKGNAYVLYHIAMGVSSGDIKRSAEYTISISEFAKMIGRFINEEDVLIKVTLQEKAMFFVNDDQTCKPITQEEGEAYLAKYSYSMESKTTADSVFHVQLWYDEHEQMQDFIKLRTFSLAILSIGVLFSTVLSLAMSYVRFSSVNTLIRSITERSVSRKKQNKWAKNEFDYIQALVDESIKDGKLVKKNMRSYQCIIREQVALMVFHGLLKNKEEIQPLLSACGTELAEEYYYLCGIRLENPDDGERLSQYIQEDIYCWEENHRYLIVLCELPMPDYNMSRRKEMAKRLMTTLDSIGISCAQIAMSQVYRSLLMANYAYLEAGTMLDKDNAVDESILCWEDLITQHFDLGLGGYNEHVQMFFQAIEDKELKRAKKALVRVLRHAEQEPENRRYIRYLILQALRLGTRSDEQTEESVSLQRQIGEVNLDDDSFDEKISGIVNGCCDRPEEQYDKILQFVNDNYTCSDLSLETIAAFANVSKSQMSKIFRILTGEGYIDYVTNLRMEKAKALLLHTDISVKEVFKQVGYVDTTTASKKFKTMFHVTPSKYRTLTEEQRVAIDENGA